MPPPLITIVVSACAEAFLQALQQLQRAAAGLAEMLRQRMLRLPKHLYRPIGEGLQ